MNTSKPAKVVPPYFQVTWDIPDASALQALARGEATPDQQKRALDWFINRGAMTYEPTFHPGMPDASAFSEGRRFVGLQAVKLLHLNISQLRKALPND